MNKSLKNSTISSVEDKLIRDLTDIAENQLRVNYLFGVNKTIFLPLGNYKDSRSNDIFIKKEKWSN